jgi:hypothetical protein
MRTSHNFKDLTGMKFGRLFVVKRVGTNKHRKALWKCMCDCGNEHIVAGTLIVRGLTVSCGCYHNEKLSNMSKTHGESKTRLYRIWKSMRERCNCITNKRYKDYGGRGIKICNEWSEFSDFKKWATNNGYKEDLTIDRIDNDKPYNPDNCRWATIKQQNNNSRNVRYLEFNGENHSVTEWANMLNMNVQIIYGRLSKGWSIERALTQKPRKSRQK